MSGRNDCPCGNAYKPNFGQWWHEAHGSQWYCEDCAKAMHNEPDPSVAAEILSIFEEMSEQDDRLALREQLANEQAPKCVTCGVTLTADDPAVTTLGPRCRKHF